ncbi:MAG: PepSY-associated TM helix domain-containing protein [Nocardioides sp.]
MTLHDTAQPVQTGYRRVAKRSRRKPVRRVLIVTHRWLALVVGLALLVASTSGAVLLYGQPIHRMLNAEAYAAAEGPLKTSFQRAFEVVSEEKPAFVPTAVLLDNGVLSVTDYEVSYTVDPVTGEYLGKVEPAPTWLAFLENLHFCFLGCEGEPGYLPVLSKEVPRTEWLGFDGAAVTYAGLTLLALGLALTYLTLTGLWLWVPRPSRWKSGITVRWRKGRFARDTDLHKLAGMAALPLLLIWGVTGAGFESELLGKGWYAMTPGTEIEAPAVLSKKGSGPDIGIDNAVAAAQTATGGYPPASVDVPIAQGAEGYDETAVYTVWLQDGFDPYRYSSYAGNLGVAVDRRTGEATVTYGFPEESVAQSMWDQWNYPTHAGFVVNSWWRIIWLILGLTPLLLAVTGVSTWLVRQRSARDRRRAVAK